MALKSVELSAADGAKFAEAAEAPKMEKPRFPFGLSLRLDEETLKKLEISDLPAVESKVSINAVAFVQSAGVNEHVDEDGNKKERKHLELQITAMELGAPEKKEGEGEEKPKEGERMDSVGSNVLPNGQDKSLAGRFFGGA